MGLLKSTKKVTFQTCTQVFFEKAEISDFKNHFGMKKKLSFSSFQFSCDCTMGLKHSSSPAFSTIWNGNDLRRRNIFREKKRILEVPRGKFLQLFFSPFPPPPFSAWQKNSPVAAREEDREDQWLPVRGVHILVKQLILYSHITAHFIPFI
jgi:hypothetical protein